MEVYLIIKDGVIYLAQQWDGSYCLEAGCHFHDSVDEAIASQLRREQQWSLFERLWSPHHSRGGR